MNRRWSRVSLGPALAALALCLAAPALARAQDKDEAEPASHPAARRSDEVNHEVHLFLLAAAGEGGAKGQLPESLSGVARQLRATLQPGGYRVALTLVNRVRNGSSLELRGVSAPLLAQAAPAPTAPQMQTTFNYTLGRVTLIEEAAGGKFIQLRPLRFSVRLPVQAGPSVIPEDTSLSTEVSVREGEPTVVGTITTGRPDELFILVISIRRAGR